MAKTKVPLMTQEWLDERCTRDEFGCLVWKGYIDQKGSGPNTQESPYARPLKGYNPMPVRRLAWKIKTGNAPGPKDRIYRTCGTYGCVEPACMGVKGPADSLRGRVVPMVQRANVARALRALRYTDLDEEAVEAIRLATTTCEQEAKLRNVSETTIAEIRRGTRWRKYEANPWLQLAG